MSKKSKLLRSKYPRFIYKDYSYGISNNNLEILFSFEIPPIKFQPKIIIKNINQSRIKKINKGTLENLIFNIGLIEIPSYWKATCSPEIIIKAGYLNQEQIKWWKRIFIQGMGQFYYENKIDWRGKNFLQIKNQPLTKQGLVTFEKKLKNRYLVPFAGGRDSIVTLESLKKSKKDISLFTVNPIEKIQRTAKVSRIKKQIIVKREIDKKILEMNKKGFLNGHTPFTSLLSFISVFCAVIFDYKHIIFSNEKSADEGNAKYLGKIINHQWAKSSVFEKMFSEYAKKYLAKDINYFSYLRKYGELKISKMLTKYPQYFPVFSSCNAGMKIIKERPACNALRSNAGRWCGNCPKCLFVYLSLYPYLGKKDLMTIFSKDIFENKKLLPVMKSLIEKGSLKPLECVGTKLESQKAFKLCLQKALRQTQDKSNVPYLLKI